MKALGAARRSQQKTHTSTDIGLWREGCLVGTREALPEEEQPEQRDRVGPCTLPRGRGACICADHCLQRGTGSGSWPESLWRRAGRVRSFSTFNLVLCPTCKSLAQLLKYYYYCSYTLTTITSSIITSTITTVISTIIITAAATTAERWRWGRSRQGGS